MKANGLLCCECALGAYEATLGDGPSWSLEPLGSRITRIQGWLDPDPFLSSPPANQFALTPLSLQVRMAVEPSWREPSGISVNLGCLVRPVLRVIMFYPAGCEEGTSAYRMATVTEPGIYPASARYDQYGSPGREAGSSILCFVWQPEDMTETAP